MLKVRTIPLLAALGLAALLLAGAAHALSGPMQFGTMPEPGATFSTVAKGTYSRIERAGLYQFGSEADLRKHFRRFGLNGAVPEDVDWKADQVLVIHLGQRNTGGYAVELESVKKLRHNRAKITAVENAPSEGHITAQVITSPYVVVALDRTIRGFDLVWKKPKGKSSSR